MPRPTRVNFQSTRRPITPILTVVGIVLRSLCGDSETRFFEKAVIGVLHQAKTDGLLPDDFTRAKRKAFGHTIQGFDQVDSCLHLMHSAVSCGAQPFDFLRAYHEVEIGDLEEGLEACLNPDRYGLSLIEPGDG